MPLCDHYLLLFCLPDGAAEAFGRHRWATGMDDGGASLRSEGGSATSRDRKAMAEPPDRRLCAAAARRCAFSSKMCFLPCDEDESRIMIISTQTVVLVLISTLFEHRSTRPDSCAHGTPAVTVIGDVTAAR